MSSAAPSAPPSRRHSASSPASSPTAAASTTSPDPFAEALSLQEAASKLGLPRGEVARLLQQASAACDKYAAAELLGPPPPGALYNHAVALTDFSRIPPDASPSSDPGDAERTRKERLRAAAAKYGEAISEETRGDSSAASASGSGAGGRTAGPQALNNLGLVLQELSSFEPAGSRERASLAAAAAARFRAAARSRPDFERAVYNLGTVLYASAPPASGGSAASVPSTPQRQEPSPPSSDRPPAVSRAEALADAAQCVALAAALRPAAPVYARSLALVQPFLPLPGKLRAGWLLVPDPLPFGSSSSHHHQQQNGGGALSFLPGSVTLVGGGSGSPPLVFPSPRERLVARWCVVDAESLRAAEPPRDAPALPRGWERDPEDEAEGHRHGNGNGGAFSQHQHHRHSASRPLRVSLSDILSATPAADASLPGPSGAGLHVRFVDGVGGKSPTTLVAPPAGFFLVAPSHASAEAWADALCVASHVARTSRGGAQGGPLARVLTPAVGTVASSGAGVVGRRPSSSGLGR